MIPKTLYDGCGMEIQCRVERSHEDSNRMMREMYLEARVDLEKKLAADAGETAAPGAPATAPESVERTIEKILKGK